MRVLFTVQPSVGHLHPLVPIAQALTDAGHETAVCTAPSFRPDVEACGLTHLDAGLDWLTSDQSTWGAFPPMPPPGPEFGAFVVTMFAEVTTSAMVKDLRAIAREWRPDLIVREGMEYGGCLAAECLGIPHASVAGNAYGAVDSPEIGYFPGNRLRVAEPLAHHRERLGLPPDPEVRMPFRHLHMCFTPPRWDGESAPRPNNTQFLRHTSTLRPGITLPAWVSELPERPTVLACLGTVFNKTPGVLEAIIDGLRDEPLNLIVVFGEHEDPARFGTPPANARLVPCLSQPRLLPHCDLLITHGGFNSVKEALAEGVPMVVIPITADQPYSAKRCAALGVAEVIEPDDRRPEAIGEAARNVLADRSYRANAQTFQAEMAELPGLERVVELLESLDRAGAQNRIDGRYAPTGSL
jgi:UDP-N-acetylglucosamine:LPS N-acetylglucosamine transferase